MFFKKRVSSVVLTLLLVPGTLLFATWVPLNSGTTNDLSAVHFPVNDTVGYAVGMMGTVLKTTNAGAEWVDISPGGFLTWASVWFTDNNTGFIVGGFNSVRKTTDGGATWTSIDIGAAPETLDLAGVHFPSSDVGYIAGCRRNGGTRVFKTTNGGQSWVKYELSTWPMAMGNMVHFPTEQIGFVLGRNGFAARTLNGGASFELLSVGKSPNWTGICFAPGDPSSGYIVGDSFVFATRDTGKTWTRAQLPEDQIFYGVSVPKDMNRAYVVGAGGQIFVNQGGPLWNPQPSGTEMNLRGVWFVPPYPIEAELFVGYAVGAVGTILKQSEIVGIEEGRRATSSKGALRVLANPCKQSIALQSAEDAQVKVFDASGRAVGKFSVTKGANLIPVSQPGVYILRSGKESVRVVVSN
ncbi:MAG: YCF48-related protein [candidate division WOR-3 bacterium]